MLFQQKKIAIFDQNFGSVPLRQLKTWLQITMKEVFHMIFHFNAAENLVAEHYEIYFDMIFHLIGAENLVAEHYERYFD